jgi:hypothetical protein
MSLTPLSLLHLRMATSGQARRFKAPSYIDVEVQQLVPPNWGGGGEGGYSLPGLGASSVSPPPPYPFVSGTIG